MVTNDGRFATTPVSASLPATWASPNGSSASVLGSTVADYGVLRGLATAAATPAEADDCRSCFGGRVSTLASSLDYFTFTAPPGTGSVTVRFTLALDGNLSAKCASILSGCTADGRVTLNSGDEAFIPLGAFVSAGNGDVTPRPPISQQEVFTFSSGELTWFYSELDVDATVGPVGRSDATTADFSSTAQFFVDVLTPGASYSTASGRVYASTVSAVPEPGGVRLAGMGALLFIAGTVYGKRRRDSVSRRLTSK